MYFFGRQEKGLCEGTLTEWKKQTTEPITKKSSENESL